MTRLENYLLHLSLAEHQWVTFLSPLPDEILEKIATSAALRDHPASRIARVILHDRKRALQALSDQIDKYEARNPQPGSRGSSPKP